MNKRQSQLKFGNEGISLAVPKQSLQECSYMSNLITDRESTFLSYFVPSKDPKMLPVYRFMFQESADLKHCNHKMQAWRFPNEIEAFNDDGEEYSGQKLLNVLRKEDVYGMVVCVRWYGGQLLGPVRFQHITNTAKQSIDKYKSVLEEERKKQLLRTETGLLRQSSSRSSSLLDQRIRQITAKDKTVNLLRKTLNRPLLHEVDYHGKSLEILDMLLQSRNSMISSLRSELQEKNQKDKKKEVNKLEEKMTNAKEPNVNVPSMKASSAISVETPETIESEASVDHKEASKIIKDVEKEE
nr:RecName: Full=IMPACT family member C14C8.09c [Schizosaccharomyces pombe 972h-]